MIIDVQGSLCLHPRTPRIIQVDVVADVDEYAL